MNEVFQNFTHPVESAFIKLHTIILASDPYAEIVQQADLIACHSTPVHKYLTAYFSRSPMGLIDGRVNAKKEMIIK